MSTKEEGEQQTTKNSTKEGRDTANDRMWVKYTKMHNNTVVRVKLIF
jgi:hypothetical protein